jgi:Alpha/beta hydrolase domain
MVEVRGPIAVAGSRLPFRSAHNSESSLYLDLSSFGYREDEFFIRGDVTVRDPDGAVIAEAAPYNTRLLVRRPAALDRFSGTVHVEPFHMLSEDTPAWTSSYRHITRRGDAWIGVTVNSGALRPSESSMPGGVAHLKSVDPARYADLHLERFEPPPAPERPGPLGFDPEQMRRRMAYANAQGHEIVSQLAALLKRGETHAVFGDRAVERVVAAGWSQTGVFWRGYLDHDHHERHRLPDGRPPFDGYLVAVAPGPTARPRDAAFVHLLSEGEVVGVLTDAIGVDDDSDAPMARGYEVPATFHNWYATARAAARHDPGDTTVHNDRPWDVLVHAVLDAIDRWLRDGTPLPRAARIMRDHAAPDGIARDEHGNARGGVRTPWVDVPVARYVSRCTCSPIVGSMEPFDQATLARLYGDTASYAARFERAVGEMKRARWLLPEDVDRVRASSR